MPKKTPENPLNDLITLMNRGAFKNETELMRYLAAQDEDTHRAMENAFRSAGAMDDRIISSFDGTNVPVKRSLWLLELSPLGHKTSDGAFSKENTSKSQPWFSVVIINEDTSFLLQANAPEAGIPSATFLVKCIKQAIAKPLPPSKPCLPTCLLLSHMLSPLVSSLRPFLDTLPRPFTWRVQTPNEANILASSVEEHRSGAVSRLLHAAETAKARGNVAFAGRVQSAALEEYSTAIEALVTASLQKATDAEMRRIKPLMSVCYANRAAVYLMEGPWRDAEEALKDAKEAVLRDADYAKAYYRQAKAHQALSQPSEAIDVLTKALRRPSLALDPGLNDALVDAYGGFPIMEDKL